MGSTRNPRGARGARKRPAPRAPIVLVADDVEDNREMYREFLVHYGMHVVTATNGREALEEAFARVPDAIVLDLSMPDIDGWEACRRLKADERTKSIPILAVSGHALKGAEGAAKAAGCDVYLIKPCLPEHVLAEIRRLISAS
ncbi:MAG TPA: response regulator [Methylomirabilota bacterium]|jgi:CheY-like chemotaxis protein